MRILSLSVLVFMTPFCFPLYAQEPLTEFSVRMEELAERISPSVVQVFVSRYEVQGRSATRAGTITKQLSGGSGVLLDPNGHIVTNAHVVQGARKIQVLTAFPGENQAPGASIVKNPGKIVTARLIGLDTETDLAVLKIEGTDLPHLKLGNSDHLNPGQLVFAFGSPLGLNSSVTTGVVSAVGRQLEPEDSMIYIQTDASINPGNSGGPLVNVTGEVVGINTLILSQSGGSEGIGFAAPSNIVRNVYEQIVKTGSVHRGEIGVTSQTITPTLASGLKLDRDWGVVIADVHPASPAERAGLRVSDVVLRLDGKIMENARQFEVNLYHRSEGELVQLEIQRGAEVLTLPVAVRERPNESDRFAPMIDLAKNLVPSLGLVVLDFDDRIVKLLPNARKTYGVVVAALAADAPYFAHELQPGDIVHSVNGVPFKDTRELRELLSKARPGDAIVLQTERSGRFRFVAFELE